MLEDWLLSSNWSLLNNGSPTHVNPGTGGLCSSDVTLAAADAATPTTTITTTTTFLLLLFNLPVFPQISPG